MATLARKPVAGAERDRPAVDLRRADHAGGDGGEDEDRLQTLAEDEQGAVEDDGAVAEVLAGGRFGRAAVGAEGAPGKQSDEEAAQVKWPVAAQ